MRYAFVTAFMLSSALVVANSKCINVGTVGTQIDKMCSKVNSKDCWSINVMKYEYDVDSWIVVRTAKYSGRPFGLAETVVKLRHPSGHKIRPYTTECIDFNGWSIDHGFIVAPYIAAMVAAPFVMSSLSLDSDNKGKQVLEIGLGGGTFDMGLHHYKPYVNITAVDIDETTVRVAKKWFGLVDSKYHHSIVEDGIVFLKNAVTAGRKFDVVMIDACDNNEYWPCPAKAFRTVKVVEMIKKVLKNFGTLMLNVMASNNLITGNWRNELRHFISVFPACLELDTYTYNIVVVCVPYKIADSTESVTKLNKRLVEVVKALKLDYSLSWAFIDFVPKIRSR